MGFLAKNIVTGKFMLQGRGGKWTEFFSFQNRTHRYISYCFSEKGLNGTMIYRILAEGPGVARGKKKFSKFFLAFNTPGHP